MLNHAHSHRYGTRGGGVSARLGSAVVKTQFFQPTLRVRHLLQGNGGLLSYPVRHGLRLGGEGILVLHQSSLLLSFERLVFQEKSEQLTVGERRSLSHAGGLFCSGKVRCEQHKYARRLGEANGPFSSLGMR